MTGAKDDFDPFADIEDEAASTPNELRTRLLASTKRGYVPLRKVLVQRPKGSTQLATKPDRASVRASTLADLVTGRQERALDLLLLVHALQPVLDGSPLHLATWATLLSGKTRCSPAGARAAISSLVEYGLVQCTWERRIPVLTPLLEDGSGDPWTRAGSIDTETGPGYFVVPHSYWDMDWAEKLTLPGKAMFLIVSAETQNPKTPAFSMAVERAKEWYGISERTAERGYTQLSTTNLMRTKVQKVIDDRHPAGRRAVYWRALSSPFTTADRMALQKVASAAARAVLDSSSNADENAAQ